MGEPEMYGDTRGMRRIALGALAVMGIVLAGCHSVISGSPTWPGATLEKVILTADDVTPGVRYDRIHQVLGQPDGAGGPPSMLSKPPGCANALTNVIARSAQRGPGSALKYAVSYDGARMVMTVLSWQLDMDALQAAAQRCATFEAFFDQQAEGIPMTTIALTDVAAGVLAYRQTMQLNGGSSSVYMAFQNVGTMAIFGMVFPAANPTIDIAASLPGTFLEVMAQQAEKIRTL